MGWAFNLLRFFCDVFCCCWLCDDDPDRYHTLNNAHGAANWSPPPRSDRVDSIAPTYVSRSPITPQNKDTDGARKGSASTPSSLLSTSAAKHTPVAPFPHPLVSISTAHRLQPVPSPSLTDRVGSIAPAYASRSPIAPQPKYTEGKRSEREVSASTPSITTSSLLSTSAAKHTPVTPFPHSLVSISTAHLLQPVPSPSLADRLTSKAAIAARPSPASSSSSSSSQGRGVPEQPEAPIPSSVVSPRVRATDVGGFKAPPGSKKVSIPVYKIPRHFEELLEKDEAPQILKDPLSSSNYADYFACLLYAEDHYLEKWSDYLLKNVSLQLCNRNGDRKNKSMSTNFFENTACLHFHKRENENKRTRNHSKYVEDERDYVAFDLEDINEKRPYLLSRDFVFLRPLNGKFFTKRFEGRFCRVVRPKTVLAEFGGDFHSQHKPENRYDVSFSFNRVCLKRAHHAVANALGPLLFRFLFPVRTIRSRPLLETIAFTDSKLDHDQRLAVKEILKLTSPPPYLIQGPSSRTESVVREAIIKLYMNNDGNRILLCTPKNRTCDNLMISLASVIPEHEMFRANAAFRELDEVPDGILASSKYDDKKECFSCPELSILKRFRLISSTYMSSFRLSNAGIGSDHFTHIFLVDASAVTEPEAVVPLASLADDKTTVVVTGQTRDKPLYVRSDLARRPYGLCWSYFHRLLRSDLYSSGDQSFVFDIGEAI